jgi:tRNA threonylcarbamoyladenosine biosynthesis protein TsaE
VISDITNIKVSIKILKYIIYKTGAGVYFKLGYNEGMEYITKNAKETQKTAAKIIKDFIKVRGSKAGVLILALEGELGAGKTTFVQGLAKGLKIKEKILSPTFVILKRFKIYDLRFKNFKNLYHIDCYRINIADEILALDFGRIISEPSNIVVIEWAEKIKEILPPETIWLKFEHLGEDERRIQIFN